MERLSVQRQEKTVFEVLVPYMKEFNMFYKPHRGMKSSFVSLTDFGVVSLVFHFNSIGEPNFSLGLSFLEIEKIMAEIGNPNVDYSDRILNKDYTDCTIYCSEKIINYDVSMYRILSEDRAKSYANAIVEFMEKFGWSFLQKYSYMPNIVDEMSKIENEKKYWRQLICGQADHFLRGLLMSKLCNDPKFEERMSYVNSVFNDPAHNLASWQPYYEKFKTKISSVIPRF